MTPLPSCCPSFIVSRSYFISSSAGKDKENSSNPFGNEKYIRAIKEPINKNMIPK